MHQALYRSERPERFNEIIGQNHIVKILQHQVKTDSVRQAYLFTGTRGTGKTTTARILAKALNCTGHPADGELPCGECENCKAIKNGSYIDVIEIDAASHNGVEGIRELIEQASFPPFYSKYKVYIIDEVHMLSTSAENAFLKTLEEPPEHVIFILATTNPEKVRETIRSRCMQLDFRRVSEADLIQGMRRICDKNGIHITDGALELIAQKGDGSVRDSLSILEQCISGGDDLLDVALVQEYIGSIGIDFYLGLTQAVLNCNMAEALRLVSGIMQEGKDAKMALSDWMEHYRNLMVAKYVDDTKNLLNVSPENVERLRLQSSQMDAATLESGIRLLSEYVNLAKFSLQPRILLETAVLHLMNGKARPSTKVDELLQTAPINRNLKMGTAPAAQPARMATEAEISKASNVMPVQNVDAKVAQDGIEESYKAVPILDKNTISSIQKTSEDIPSNTESTVSEGIPSNTESTVSEGIPSNIELTASDGMIQNNSNPAEGTSNAAILQDFNAMWNQIVDAVASVEGASFRVMVGNNSRIDEYRNGEIIVKVKSTKLPVAMESQEQILDSARKLFGQHVYVTLRKDDGIVTGAASEGGVPVQDLQTRMDLPGMNGNGTSNTNTETSAQETNPVNAPSGIQGTDNSFGSMEGNSTEFSSSFDQEPDVPDYEETLQSNSDVVSDILDEASALFGMSVDVRE